MFSIQQFFSKGDRFQELFEAAANESRESVRLAVELAGAPNNDDARMQALILARRREKEISDKISSLLMSSFVTGLEREDIEGLARGLFRIPKAALKLGERLHLTRPHLTGCDFSRQLAMMTEATEAVCGLIKQLRAMKDIDRIKSFNDRLQVVELQSDKFMNELLGEIYAGKYEPIRAMAIRDVGELMEKVVDRCHDAGNTVMYIILKNS
jgi:uncharacterized protein Yka (UPF0111/DUF47 family)